jgi:hypothetical protein
LETPLPPAQCITNWTALHHRYKPENIPYLNKALNARDEFEKKLPLDDWKVSVDDKKDGLTVWVRTTPDGLNAVKAQGIVNYSPDQIFTVLADVNYKKLYDDAFDEGKNFEKIADQTFFHYQKVKKVFPVSARDFILILHYNKTPEGIIYVLAFDTGRPDMLPEVKNVVRASVPVSLIISHSFSLDWWLEIRAKKWQP